MKYYSQYHQDFIIDQLLQEKRNGVFIDIGAYDGVKISNSFFFEKFRNWSGICIEPNPDIFDKLKENRQSIVVNAGISPQKGQLRFRKFNPPFDMLSGLVDWQEQKHLNRINRHLQDDGATFAFINVPCFLLNDVLERHHITTIDYCSIDTEGGEFDILKSIDFDKYCFKSFSIEYNYEGEKDIIKFMKKKGYQYLSKPGPDLIFIRKEDLKWFSFIRQPKLFGKLLKIYIHWTIRPFLSTWIKKPIKSFFRNRFSKETK